MADTEKRTTVTVATVPGSIVGDMVRRMEELTEETYEGPTEADLREHARFMHARQPAKTGIQCPDCYRFSASAWTSSHQTQDGNFYTWGGICKTHGAWSEST